MKLPADCRWKATGRTLGKGGQAAVIEVEDTKAVYTGKFALKGLSSGRPQKAYERFAREVEAMQSVEDPSIVRIVDVSAPDAEFKYYVMELVADATPLKKLLNTNANPYAGSETASLRFFLALLNAMQAWERVGIVHRDLSPSNVLILGDGSIKVIDFGICQPADSETITLIDEGVGSQNYMAPECESGAEGDVSIASDLYSAGKLLWAAITNLNAFSRENPAFSSKSMPRVFPDNPSAWHLHHVFEATIRHRRQDRAQSVEDAIRISRHTLHLIEARYPPIEAIMATCPLCGHGRLDSFQYSHMVFGNPNPPGIAALQCKFCGYCFARNFESARKEIARRESLT